MSLPPSVSKEVLPSSAADDEPVENVVALKPVFVNSPIKLRTSELNVKSASYAEHVKGAHEGTDEEDEELEEEEEEEEEEIFDGPVFTVMSRVGSGAEFMEQDQGANEPLYLSFIFLLFFFIFDSFSSFLFWILLLFFFLFFFFSIKIPGPA